MGVGGFGGEEVQGCRERGGTAISQEPIYTLALALKRPCDQQVVFSNISLSVLLLVIQLHGDLGEDK